MKFLLLLNENNPGSHDDVYRALDENKKMGEISSYVVYPFLSKLKSGLRHQEVNEDIFKIAKEYQPEMILWSHTIKLKVFESTIKKLKGLYSKPVSGYWDGDIYESPYKPLPKNIIELAVKSEVTFCQGFGPMSDLLKMKGCSDIRYVPAATDPVRFNLEKSNSTKLYDIVLIGNNVLNFLPWKRMPGAIFRKKLADYFYSKLGNKFAVFGDGWKAEYSKGSVPFTDQTKIYQNSRLAIGVNNLFSEYYFSNRLPISMTSGVPVLYKKEYGFEKIFPYDTIKTYSTVEEAWGIAEEMLSKSDEELNSIGNKCRDFVLNNLTMTKNFTYMINVLKSYKSNTKKNIVNPWINN